MVRTAMLMAVMVITAGCQNENDRLAEMASRHAAQQSELSKETVRLQSELVEGTQNLVEADAAARRDFIELGAKLDKQRAEIARGQEELHGERRDIAEQRHRDPIVANAVLAAGSLLACLLPLLLAAYLLRSQLEEPDDHATTELLLAEIAARHPAFDSPARPLIGDRQAPSPPRIEADEAGDY